MFNPLAMRTGLSGTETLAVKRSRSGEVQRIPVIPVEHGGQRYLVSVRGESDWVKNLRAAGGEAELGPRNDTIPIRASEVPVSEREPILAAYRDVAGRAVKSHFEALPDPADHPVFRIDGR